MSTFDFDLFVIGGGSGGVRAARVAAGHGARVGIAEEYRFGGTCVIRGCVPKKLLVYASRFAADFEDAAGFGWRVQRPDFDWATLVAAKDKEVARLEALYAANLEKVDATLFAERAILTGPNQVSLGSGRTLTAAKILVATGGRPLMPRELPGVRHSISSNEAFDLKELPRRIAIVGGGYVALEFAGIFAGLGSKVTLVHRGDHVLRHFDQDLSSRLVDAYRARGIQVELGSVFLKLERSAPSCVPAALPSAGPAGPASIAATFNTGNVLEFDQVMFAIGRSPNVEGLGLDHVGVQTDRNGAIIVDTLSRTSLPSVYAIGDVTNRLNLTPVAIREGHAFADTVFGNMPWTADYSHVPTAVFSTPEIGTVGLPEEQAIREYAVIDIYRTEFRTLKATVSGSAEKMMMKIVVDGSTDRVLGVHLMGPDAGELIQVITTLLRTGVTKRDFDQTMPLHPSSAEELMTLRTRSARHVQHHDATLGLVT